MTTKFCGHNRDLVIWACCFGAIDPSRVDALFADNEADPAQVSVCRDVRDPAKLAELMAEEFRRRGVKAAVIEIGQHSLMGNKVTIRVGKTQIVVITRDTVAFLDMHQSRAAILRIMQLPEGTPVADVLKALEVVQ